ncbi:Nucleotidyltransferase [Rickenella mellea]|uniref:Nucleotidyltransferase n=1 Tax=Rickenella mellea TaxID=50990 RepID=A0A4Y7PYU7_9AGAM|nr:Nucleotidyltransferase [Rickenella mellea]
MRVGRVLATRAFSSTSISCKAQSAHGPHVRKVKQEQLIRTTGLKHTSGKSIEGDNNEVEARLGERNIDFSQIPPIPPSILRARRKTINLVQDIVQQKWGRDFTVKVFGSTEYGADTPSSDLDLVISDRRRKHGFSPSADVDRLPDVYDVRQLAKALRHGGMHVSSVISKATVPIVKFKDPSTHIHCDVNVNDELGYFNTQLISRYCELSPLLRPMLYWIKLWARANGLSNPSGLAPTSFTSYAFVTMTIGFLQIQGLLPNLQQGIKPYPHNVERAEGLFWLRRKNDLSIRCDYRFSEMHNWKPKVDTTGITVEKALGDWFHYWGHRHNYAEEFLSIRHGGVAMRIPRAAILSPFDVNKLPRTKKGLHLRRLWTEDPYGDALALAHDASSSAPTVPGVSPVDGNVQREEDTNKLRDLGLFRQRYSPGWYEAGHLTTMKRPEKDNANRQPSFSPPDFPLPDSIEDEDEAIEQPSGTRHHLLVVADPFILSKNLTARVTKPVAQRFISGSRNICRGLGIGKTRLVNMMPEPEFVPGRGWRRKM